MLNVLEFRKSAPRDRGTKPGRAPATPGADIAELASRVCDLQWKAKREIDRAVLMLEVAVQQARELAKRMHDPSVRKQFDENISMIEQQLRFTRGLALKL
jgi:hypothetical protein